MNDRLKELMDQCWVQVTCDFDMQEGGLSTIKTVFDRERFAQLLIREHLDILRQEWYDLNNSEPVPEESPRDVGLRVGRKTEIVTLIDKVKKHWSYE